MKNTSITKIYFNFVGALVITLFVYTALSKFSELSVFRNIISKSPLIGKASAVMAIIIPSTELVIAFFLFMPALRNRGMIASLILMILFTLYIIYMLLFAPQLPCSCGGVITSMSWPAHLIFNTVVTGLITIAIILNKYKIFIAINRRSRTPV